MQIPSQSVFDLLKKAGEVERRGAEAPKRREGAEHQEGV